jgi:thiamine kinase-like enzyme
MVANDMVNKKGTELKQKAEGLQIVERQYVMMKKAAVDLANLFKYYEEDVSNISPNQV